MERILDATARHPLRSEALWRRILRALLRADATYRQRHAMDRLSDHHRRDAGLPPRDWTPPVVMQRIDLR